MAGKANPCKFFGSDNRYKIVAVLTLVLCVAILVLVILMSRGVLSWGGNRPKQTAEGYTAAPPEKQHYLVALIKLRGCPACVQFLPHFERAAQAAQGYFEQKPTCPKHIGFAAVEVSSPEAQKLFAAGLKRPSGVPHVALFRADEKGAPVAFVASLPDSAYTYTSMWKWVDDQTSVDKCSGWYDQQSREYL